MQSLIDSDDDDDRHHDVLSYEADEDEVTATDEY